MLYLLEDRDYLKIGYSKNVEERLKTHRTSNCYIQLLGTKPGTSKDEKVLHKLCEQYKYSTEWFYNVPEVKEIFWNYQSGTEDIFWIKELVTRNYNNFIKSSQFIELTNKELREIRRMELSAQDIPELNKWLHCFRDQTKLKEVFNYIKYGVGKIDIKKIKMFYDILPDACYNISKNVMSILFDVKNTIESYEKDKEEYLELKPIVESHEETLDQNRRYFQLRCSLEEFDIKILKNKVKFYQEFMTKFSSED